MHSSHNLLLLDKPSYNACMQILLIVHNIRSTHNVGSLLRTAECLGVKEVYLTGYTPYPLLKQDSRLPHESARTHKQIHKTALGAEDMLNIHRYETLAKAVSDIRRHKIDIVAIEQHPKATPMPLFKPTTDVALLMGNEVKGLEKAALDLCDEVIEIPMLGKKESLNVVQAASIALYQAAFWNNVVE